LATSTTLNWPRIPVFGGAHPSNLGLRKDNVAASPAFQP
jgi:hypothetical protein